MGSREMVEPEFGCRVNYPLSDVGEGLLIGSGITYVDDAVDKFLETIDYFEQQIDERWESMNQCMKAQMEDPVGNEFLGEARTKINLDIIFYEQTLEALRGDLDMLMGDRVPF